MNAEALNALIQAELPRAQRGDQAAYGRIVAACQGGISAIALAMVRDVPSSEDIAQEAFIKGWTSLPRLRNPSSFLPWLRQITRNLARDHLRDEPAPQPSTVLVGLSGRRGPVPGPGEGPWRRGGGPSWQRPRRPSDCR